MSTPEPDRIALRRETHDLNDALDALAGKLDRAAPAAAVAVRQARCALFDAWTILCEPPKDEDGH